MNDTDTAATASAAASRGRRARYVTAMVAAVSLLAFLATFAVWANRQALNTNNWTDTSSKLLEDKTIRDAVALYLVDQLYADVDVAKELRKVAPDNLKGLSGPASALLRQAADRVAKRALATPQVQQAWEDANRIAHRQLLLVLENRNNAVSTANGVVTLDLNLLVRRIANEIGLSRDLVDKLPERAGQLEILRSDQLDLAQTIARLIKRLALVLSILTVIGYGLAVYLADGRRRETLRSVGIGLIVAGILVLLARGLIGKTVVNSLASTAAAVPPAEHAWNIGTTLLDDIARGVIASGLLVVLAAWIAGPMHAAVRFRRTAAPYLRTYPGFCFGVGALLLLLLIIWAPTNNFRNLPTLLVYVIAGAVGIEMLRRQAAAEFPEAAALAAPITGVDDAIDRMRQAASRHGSAIGAAVSKMRAGQRGAPADPVGQLERLGALRERGLLSEDEFETAKHAVLRA